MKLNDIKQSCLIALRLSVISIFFMLCGSFIERYQLYILVGICSLWTIGLFLPDDGEIDYNEVNVILVHIFVRVSSILVSFIALRMFMKIAYAGYLLSQRLFKG